MYEYKVVELGFKKLGLKVIASSELEDYKEIINEDAE